MTLEIALMSVGVLIAIVGIVSGITSIWLVVKYFRFNRRKNSLGSCFLYNPANVGNLISGFSSFSKHSLDIWKFLVYIMLKCSMQDFKHALTSMGDKCNCPRISTFFSTTLLGNWDED